MKLVPINSCDFSPETYNFDNISDDFDLTEFDRDLKMDEELGMFAMIHDAQSRTKDASGLQLLASPWSPPYWMKTDNHEMIGSEMPCLKGDQRYHRAWAEYRSLWFQGYAKQGINFTYHTVQNEPANYINVWWEQCFFDAQGEADFIANHLGPVMERDGHNISLLFYDYNKGGMNNWANVVLSNPNAAKYISGIALHWYDGYFFDNVRTFQEKYGSQYYQLATEGCSCDGILDQEYDTEWKRAMRYVEDILGDLNAGVVGWMDWSILLNIVENGAGGPNHSRLKNWCYTHIHVTNNSDLLVYRSYYTFSHISRFVVPGSRRIGITMDSSGDGLVCSAFVTPDESNIILVVSVLSTGVGNWDLSSNMRP
ncbi:Glucosylceramidase precursor, putative [Perkinsus marinus ATCC 50983]|uniref:Glucosylceramidase, putative n=1 Tax=Perkinsus marinus (strain ATCC 50983 / TXsc) TaxID=423536 RepID=C5LD21_PERM5|nr:Glucosylceramidase precursor, putative [Perkinsus marinus ATCC 50983]EER05365.1 Glucosylceramidase precursor, putative [Perkinsus marinus ATCC 50983]|eukprot:XP_002773549.1 Glucosylceramidase precursor, putative [Perkinsus marinus ATCC 50983]